MAANNIQNLPQELLIMIIERLNLKESSAFCEAVNISVEWAFQYFNFVRDKNQFKTGRLKMKLAQALVKNDLQSFNYLPVKRIFSQLRF